MRPKNRMMRVVRLPLLLLPAAALFAAGCLSRAALEQRIQEARTEAADAWSNRLAGAECDLPRLAGTLTLPDALTLALAHNKTLQSALLEREIAQGRITEAYGQALPTLSAQGTAARLDPAPAGGAGGTDGDPFTRYSAGLQLRQPLYRGGAIGAALTASRLYAFWADAFIRGQTQEMLYQTALAFYQVLLADRLQAAAAASLASADAQRQTALNRATEGAASRYDVLRAEVAAANAQADLIQQQNSLRLARLRLFQLLGVLADPALAVAGDLTFEPAAPRLADTLRTAHQNRPDLAQADLLVGLQRESLAVANSRYYPSAFGLLTHTWTRQENGAAASGDWNPDWMAAIEVDMPFFDGLSREGQIAQERALLRRREIERADAEERVLLELNQALAALEDADKLVASQALNLDRARDALALAEAGFREGVHTSTDVADTRAALRLAEGLHAQALFAHTQARLTLRRAMGTLDPGDPNPAALPAFRAGDAP